jgi:hypothetical protein
MKNGFDDIDKSDTSSSNQYKLKYKKEDSIGFRYSKYKESFITNEKKTFLQPDQQSWCTKFKKQTALMTWKNYLVASRNPKLALFQIITPIFICVLLVVLQQIMNIYNSIYVIDNPDNYNLSTLDKCLNPSDCVTIGYAIIVRLFNLE